VRAAGVKGGRGGGRAGCRSSRGNGPRARCARGLGPRGKEGGASAPPEGAVAAPLVFSAACVVGPEALLMCPPVLMRRLYRPCTHPPTSTLRSCKQSPKERERQTAGRPTARRLARSRAPLLGNKNHDGACPPGPGQSRHLRRRPWLSVRCLGRRLCSPALKWIGQGSFGVARGAGTSSREESFFPLMGGGKEKLPRRGPFSSPPHTHTV
jgi:hypothetical protein